MKHSNIPDHETTRRRLLGILSAGALAILSARAEAEETVHLRVAGGPSTRPIKANYPQKGRMILQRTNPPGGAHAVDENGAPKRPLVTLIF
jgi:hypothetical protein